MITTQNNLSLHPVGSPCRFIDDNYIIYGRYVGNSNLRSVEDPIILIGTPRNSIIHAAQSKVCFDITEEDLSVLKEFEEDAMEHQEWYHASRCRDELSCIGTFIQPNEIDPVRLL